MTQPAAPHIAENLSGEFVVAFQAPTKTKPVKYVWRKEYTFSKDKANRLLQQHICLRVLWPLYNYAKSQEQIIGVMALGNPMRKKPIGKLHRYTRALTNQPLLTPADCAEAIHYNLLPLFMEGMPGKSSRYLPLAEAIGKTLCDFVREHEVKKQDALTHKIPH